MTVIQHELQQGTTRMKTWLPVDKRVKEGTRITLAKESGVWTVLRQFEAKLELGTINRGWNNNI